MFSAEEYFKWQFSDRKSEARTEFHVRGGFYSLTSQGEYSLRWTCVLHVDAHVSATYDGEAA